MSPSTQDSDTEYGYDFTADEEELLLELASNTLTLPHRASISQASAKFAVRDEASKPHLEIAGPRIISLPTQSEQDQVYYPNLSAALRDLEKESTPNPPDERRSDGDDSQGLDPDDDGRSPLQRFRTYPRKPLTVSDLTSGAWCELQYWYTLTRLPGGRRTRTPAMQQGTRVHQQLQDEVHNTVRIDITTKEDGFGLRLWNLVQGLRTLRDTGLTRELEVWGMVDGNVVNGVIDSVSSQNPNPEFEQELSSQRASRTSLLTGYFPSEGSRKETNIKYYLTDVKTRGSTAPVSNAALRPAKIQLLLYHRFLLDMAAGKLDFQQVLSRYGLDADGQFSDSFMAQIGDLHDDVFFDSSVSSADQIDPDQDGAPDLLKYRTLRELLPLIEEEIRLTFPSGPASLGCILTVQYMHRSDGRVLDSHDFPVSPPFLDDYLAKYMSWWRGERKPFGVDTKEAFKCGSCDFAPDCTWRRSMDSERVNKVKERMRGKRPPQW